MSPKAMIVILWACVIAGAAVASEKYRTTIDYEEHEYEDHAIELHETVDPHLQLNQKCDAAKRLT
jgi:hypothetical protein